MDEGVSFSFGSCVQEPDWEAMTDEEVLAAVTAGVDGALEEYEERGFPEIP